MSFANHAGTAVLAFVLARALGLSVVRLPDCLALVPVASLLSAIPLLPGGWGVGELAFAYFFGPVGVAPSEAVALSVVLRLAILASGLPGGVLWLLSREHARRADMAAEVAAAERAHRPGAAAGRRTAGRELPRSTTVRPRSSLPPADRRPSSSGDFP